MSDRPPSYPVNTICLPSGDHEGVVSPFSGTLDAADLFVLLHVENDEVVAVATLRGDGEVAPVGRERAGRIDEAEALVVRVQRRPSRAAA